jgi:V-type H+-transporting ATPase subunit d
MIDNVVLIVTGTLHERDVNELLEKCHPLGMFDRYYCCVNLFFSFFFCQLRCAKTPNTNHYVLLINSIASLAVAQNMRELYRLVLVDTPLAPYFSECITSEVNTAADHLCITSVL